MTPVSGKRIITPVQVPGVEYPWSAAAAIEHIWMCRLGSCPSRPGAGAGSVSWVWMTQASYSVRSGDLTLSLPVDSKMYRPCQRQYGFIPPINCSSSSSRKRSGESKQKRGSGHSAPSLLARLGSVVLFVVNTLRVRPPAGMLQRGLPPRSAAFHKLALYAYT